MSRLIARSGRRPGAGELQAGRFVDPERTADGKRRASVSLRRLRTLWFNTGTLCNVECRNCYIESGPRNDRLAYLSRDDVRGYLAELSQDRLGTEEIGFTGGEPFLNPHLPGMLEDCLAEGYRVLVLTNAMRPMIKRASELLRLRETRGHRLTLRVSLDHYLGERHEEERGRRSWAPALAGLRWLCEHGFCVHVAGRQCWGESEAAMRSGYRRLFLAEGLGGDLASPERLMLFPEMDAQADTPEITTECWQTLGVDPADMMCASSRMVVKRKGAPRPEVVACTLLPYDSAFSFGEALAGAVGEVALNHPHCSRFCVLGGGKCSG